MGREGGWGEGVGGGLGLADSHQSEDECTDSEPPLKVDKKGEGHIAFIGNSK